jgi:hypothetical protein
MPFPNRIRDIAEIDQKRSSAFSNSKNVSQLLAGTGASFAFPNVAAR